MILNYYSFAHLYESLMTYTPCVTDINVRTGTAKQYENKNHAPHSNSVSWHFFISRIHEPCDTKWQVM